MASVDERTAAPAAARVQRGAVEHERAVRAHAPGFIVVVLALVLAAQQGGYATTTWYPAALFMLALTAIAVTVELQGRLTWPRSFTIAVIAFGLLVLWSYASITWSDVRADAWDGANRTLLYWLAFVVVGLIPWSRRAASLAVMTIVVGVGAIAVAMLVLTALRADPERLFLERRLSEPTGYANATAALWLIAFWPAVHFATATGRGAAVRGLALGLACLLLEISVLSQSRGAVAAFVVTTVVYLALTPARATAAAALALLLGLTAIAWPDLVAIRVADTVPALRAALGDARLVIAVCCAAATLVGALAVLASRWLVGETARGRARSVGDRALAVLATIAACAAVGLAATHRDWLGARWDDFRNSGYERVEQGGSRFGGSLGSGRFDYYRVALNEFRGHPVHGIGADNFAVPYLIHRRTLEAPAYPHSVALAVLSQLGVVGAALFVAFLTAAIARRRSGARDGDRLRAAALAGTVYWLVHGLGDWLWEVPALALLALSLLAIAARMDEDLPPAPRPGLRRPRRRLAVAVCAFALVSASLVPPWLAASYTSVAVQTLPTDPASSFAALHRATRLNPLSAGPLISQGVLARRLGQPDAARRSLEWALRREPRSWFARFELALVELQARRRDKALVDLRLAARLNPRQPTVAMVRERTIKGQSVDANAVELKLYGQLERKLRPLP